MKYKNTLLTIAFGFLNVSSTLDAQQPDIKGIALEKAIFLQESKKDYKAASELLKSVIEKYKDHELEAKYRLSQCYLQMDNKADHLTLIKELAQNNNTENRWVKLAIKENPIGIDFKKGKWEDGDVYGYDLELQDGSKIRFYTLVYEELKGENKENWKMTTLRSSFNVSRSEIVFDHSSYQPFSEYWKFLDREPLTIHNQISFDKKRTWDKQTFHNDMITSLAMVLPDGLNKNEFFMEIGEHKSKVLLHNTGKTKVIKTDVGQFDCKQVICKIQGLDIVMWVNSKGKNELIALQQTGLKIELAEVTKLDEWNNRSISMKAFPYDYKSKTGFHALVINNDEVYRSIVYPEDAVYLARLEVNHKKNLLPSLQKDATALAVYLEGQIRKLTDSSEMKLPEDTEHLTLADCKGVLYTTTIKDSYNDIDDHYVCFYGISNKTAIFLRGLYEKGNDKAAIAEVKRILTEDLTLTK